MAGRLNEDSGFNDEEFDPVLSVLSSSSIGDDDDGQQSSQHHFHHPFQANSLQPNTAFPESTRSLNASGPSIVLQQSWRMMSPRADHPGPTLPPDFVPDPSAHPYIPTHQPTYQATQNQHPQNQSYTLNPSAQEFVLPTHPTSNAYYGNPLGSSSLHPSPTQQQHDQANNSRNSGTRTWIQNGIPFRLNLEAQEMMGEQTMGTGVPAFSGQMLPPNHRTSLQSEPLGQPFLPSGSTRPLGPHVHPNVPYPIPQQWYQHSHYDPATPIHPAQNSFVDSPHMRHTGGFNTPNRNPYANPQTSVSARNHNDVDNGRALGAPRVSELDDIINHSGAQFLDVESHVNGNGSSATLAIDEYDRTASVPNVTQGFQRQEIDFTRLDPTAPHQASPRSARSGGMQPPRTRRGQPSEAPSAISTTSSRQPSRNAHEQHRYRCETCKQELKGPREWQRHLKTDGHLKKDGHYNTDRFHCDTCHKSYNRLDNLKRHKKNDKCGNGNSRRGSNASGQGVLSSNRQHRALTQANVNTLTAHNAGNMTHSHTSSQPSGPYSSVPQQGFWRPNRSTSDRVPSERSNNGFDYGTQSNYGERPNTTAAQYPLGFREHGYTPAQSQYPLGFREHGHTPAQSQYPLGFREHGYTPAQPFTVRGQPGSQYDHTNEPDADHISSSYVSRPSHDYSAFLTPQTTSAPSRTTYSPYDQSPIQAPGFVQASSFMHEHNPMHEQDAGQQQDAIQQHDETQQYGESQEYGENQKHEEAHQHDEVQQPDLLDDDPYP